MCGVGASSGAEPPTPAGAGYLDGVDAHLTGADPHQGVDRHHPDLPVADVAGLGRTPDGLGHLGGVEIVDDDLELDLGHEVHPVLRTPIGLGVPALAAEPLHLGHGHTLHADAPKGVLHAVEHVGLDYRCHELHRLAPLSVTEARGRRFRLHWLAITPS